MEKYAEELRKMYRQRYGVQKTLIKSHIDELKKYLLGKLVGDNSDSAVVYICNGGGPYVGFPKITTNECFTIHSQYNDSFFSWLDDNDFSYSVSQLGKNECPPAHCGWISRDHIKKVQVRL